MSAYLLIRPACFGYNIETAASNGFQQLPEPKRLEQLQERALQEFNGLVEALKAHKVEVLVCDDNAEPRKTCAVFPNNWFSTHEDGRLVLYPMLSESRRQERRPEIIETIKENFVVDEVLDLSYFEKKGQYLEGTGSLVLDREHKIAYACLSPRTHIAPLQQWAVEMAYELVPFRAVDAVRQPIYHTNVMMWIGKKIAGICLESIPNAAEQKNVLQRLEQTGHRLLVFSLEQLNRYCGNMLEVESRHGHSMLVMSEAAYQALSPLQKQLIEERSKIISVPLSTIESIGGGSARCMIAEVVLEKHKALS